MLNQTMPMVESAAIACALIAAYEGARRIASSGFSKIAALLLAFGLLVPCSYGGAMIFLGSTMHDVLDFRKSVASAECPSGSNANISQEQIAKQSRADAALTYKSSGKLSQQVDVSGNHVLFAPTQAEISDREESVITRNQIEMGSSYFHLRGVSLVLYVLSSVIIGLLVGRRQRVKQVDPI